MNREYDVCDNCGDVYKVTNPNQKYCHKDIKQICPICGSTFVYSCGTRPPKTCGSKECQYSLSELSREEYYTQQVRICRVCGNKFVPVNNKQVLCPSEFHIFNCKVCGKEYRIITKGLKLSELRCTCGKECETKLQLHTKQGKKCTRTI